MTHSGLLRRLEGAGASVSAHWQRQLSALWRVKPPFSAEQVTKH